MLPSGTGGSDMAYVAGQMSTSPMPLTNGATSLLLVPAPAGVGRASQERCKLA
jgi:hypothetical protein